MARTFACKVEARLNAPKLWQIPCPRCAGIAEIGDRVCRLCAGSGIYLMTRGQYLEWFEGEMVAGRTVATDGNRTWRRYADTDVGIRRPISMEITR